MQENKVKTILLNWVKSPIFWIIFPLVVIGLIAVLGFYQGVTIAVAVFSTMIATISAFIASRSLEITSESLKLTREKVRPFIYVTPGDFKMEELTDGLILYYDISNLGVLPGELVSGELAFFKENETITNDNISEEFPLISEIPNLPIVFPNSLTHVAYTILYGRLIASIMNGKIKTRHRIYYKDKSDTYLTIQTEYLQKIGDKKLRRVHDSPQYWT